MGHDLNIGEVGPADVGEMADGMIFLKNINKIKQKSNIEITQRHSDFGRISGSVTLRPLRVMSPEFRYTSGY